MPALSEQDLMLVQDFGIKRGLDIITASYVRKPEDVEEVKRVIDEKGKHVSVFAKIQNVEGLRNFNEILQVADGIMIDRHNLGMELTPEKVIIAQKWMIQQANIACKPIVVFSNVLESMMHLPDPN